MTQYHHLDESGDPPPGLSGDFALALVQLAERRPVPTLASARRDLHLSPDFEFKFHKTSPLQKAVFFQSIRSLEFRLRAVVVDKRRLPVSLSAYRGLGFAVELAAQLVLRASVLDIADDVLVMDGATPHVRRAMRVRLSEICRATGRARPFAKIVSADSIRDDGLQLADMLVGACRRHSLHGDSLYYSMIAPHVADLWLPAA